MPLVRIAACIMRSQSCRIKLFSSEDSTASLPRCWTSSSYLLMAAGMSWWEVRSVRPWSCCTSFAASSMALLRPWPRSEGGVTRFGLRGTKKCKKHLMRRDLSRTKCHWMRSIPRKCYCAVSVVPWLRRPVRKPVVRADRVIGD